MIKRKRNAYVFICLWVIGLVCAAATSEAATYYVATSGNNTNLGSQQSPLLAIGYAVSKTTAGDIVRVQAGTFEERVAVKTSGTNGAWLNYVADGRVICRGFDLNGVNYARIIGFEITHTNTMYNRAITFAGSCSHVDIIDNYIHEVNGGGIHALLGMSAAPSYITVRGNTFYYMGCVPGVISNGNALAVGSVPITSHHWLVEYNRATRCGDFTGVYGTNIIARNNYFADYRNSYFPDGTGDGLHVDMFQPGSGGAPTGSRNHNYERNFCGDNVELNSHFLLWRNTILAGDTNVMVRGNVCYNFGSGLIYAGGVGHFCLYNNSFYDVEKLAGDGYPILWTSEGTNGSPNGMAMNVILDTTPLPRTKLPFYGDNASAAFFSHNLGYLTGYSPSYVSTSDPLFIDAVNRNFRLQTNSPAINAGTNIAWVTSANGSGTTFNVNDGQLLIDGWGMVDGDTVTVGGTTTKITSISGNSVTVGNSVAWTSGTPVYWGTDTRPDIGALPYGSTELTAATLVRSGTTYTVRPTGDARGVWFYVDGIPTTWVSVAPYTATITNGTVTAKAYALYAQAKPVVEALLPAWQSNLRFVPGK